MEGAEVLKGVREGQHLEQHQVELKQAQYPQREICNPKEQNLHRKNLDLQEGNTGQGENPVQSLPGNQYHQEENLDLQEEIPAQEKDLKGPLKENTDLLGENLDPQEENRGPLQEGLKHQEKNQELQKESQDLPEEDQNHPKESPHL